MAAWDWDAYHAELLRRTRTVPPLMQSVWNESANEADWLAPAQFPLPIYRLLPNGDKARRRSLLSEQPCDPRDDEGITAIALRQGIVEDLFRSSLIWSLVKQTSSERLRFFGMPGTNIEHPRVGYVHWREIPTCTPFVPARKPCELSEVMTRSLKRLSAGSSANVPTSQISIDRKRLPQTPEDEASAFPQVIVLDVTTRSADASKRIAHLKAMLNEGSTRFDLPPCEIVMLLGASDLTIGIIAGRAFGKDEDHVIYVDAPATRQELQTFCLGWERWRKTEGGPRRLLERAGQTLENSIHCLSELDMEDPSDAVNPFWGRKRELSTKQATLDIMCTVIAMQSDARNTMAASALARLCDRLLERTNYKQQHDLVCLLWAFLKARGFDNALRLADEVIVGATAFASYNRPSALTFFFGPDADAILQREFDRAEKNRGSKGYYFRACYVIMHENPLLSSIFRTIYIGDGPNGESRLQLMNEPLALGFLAQDACRHLIERTDGITEDILGGYPELMDPQAWATFVEQLFGALDEANAPLLARQVLHAVYPHCVKFNQNVANTGFRKLHEIGVRRFDGPSSTLWDKLKSALKTTEKVMQEGYADTVVRASLRHNLATGGTVPPAWAHWIGEPLLDDDFDGELWLPNKKEIAKRVAYLHELLGAPIPACDNAALLLTYAGKL